MTTTAKDWRTLPAGRELDALVAERVDGWKWVRLTRAYHKRVNEGAREPHPYAPSRWFAPPSDIDEDLEPADLSEPLAANMGVSVPRFSTDIAAAWPVVDKLRAEMPFTLHDVDGIGGHWQASFEVLTRGGAGRGRIITGIGDTPALACCRAALAATEAR